MRSLLKVKIAVVIISVSILVLIPMLESKFNSPVVIRRWNSELTWSDFQGIPKIVSQYSAVIHSNIYLEYDSINKKFYSYAGQNNIRSWVKDESDYGLHHEQYHFNIAEVHARYMNQYIHDNPDKQESFYELKLRSLQIEMSKMQDEYDKESNHSLILDQQRRWEYKIDSLLYSGSGWTIDYFSGGKIFFPKKPEFKKAIHDNGNKDRLFYLEEYGVTFGLSSIQMKNVDLDLFRRNLIYSNHETIRIISIDTTGYPLQAETLTKADGFTTYSKFICDSSYLLIASSKYEDSENDSVGFIQISKSFIGSFSVTNTDSFWIEKAKESNQVISGSSPYVRGNSGACLNIRQSADLFFYRGPFFTDEGSMVIAYDNFYHTDSLILENILEIDGKILSTSGDSLGRVFIIPKKYVPTREFNLNFGYLLKEDSTRPCYNFHHQTLDSYIIHR